MAQTINDRIADEIGRYPQGLTAEEVARNLGVDTQLVQERCSKMASAGRLKRLKQKRIVYKLLPKHHLVYVLAD
jgi:predicted transcriptional regulator of viral defense system